MPREFIPSLKMPAVGLAIVFAGCANPKQEEIWIPLPRVSWEHVGAASLAAPTNSYRLLADGPTTGLFPANAAVTRIALTADGDLGDDNSLHPQLYTDPRNEFLRWNSVLDDQMAVSEVFPIEQRDLGGGPAVPEQILAAFRGLHARLGLIYAVNELSPTQAEMFGTLYEVATTKPLATIHAQAESVPLAPDAEEPDDPYHLWKTDARALVRQRFALLAHDCIRELIKQDHASAIEAPTGWTPAGPTKPVEWPPRRPSYRGGP